MPYIVALDPRVLLPRPGRVDVALFHLAAQQVYWARWSDQIMDDLRILWRQTYPKAPASVIDEYIAELNDFEFGYDAAVRPNPFLRSHEQARVDLGPHALHALEAAAHGGAHAVLTTNPEDYPAELTRGLVIQAVDEFLSGWLELHPVRYAKAFQIWARENHEQQNGPTTVVGLIDQLECVAPAFANEARAKLLSLVST